MHCGERRRWKRREGEVKAALDAARRDSLNYIDCVDMEGNDAEVRMTLEEKDR